MLTVNRGVAQLGQHDISRHDHFLAGAGPPWDAQPETPLALVHDPIPHKRVVLAMIHHCQSEHPSVFHGAAHDFVILNAMSVVSKGNHASVEKGTEGRQLFTTKALCDRTGAENIYARFASGFFFDPGDRRRAVGRRIGIRHRDDRGESSRRSCTCSGSDRLLVRLSGLAQMNVDINQAG